MKTKENVTRTIGIIMAITFIVMIINITLNLREFGLNSAKSKANIVAQSVRNGLTAHMVNNMMKNRNFYIKQTKELNSIDDIWIVRSDIVTKQYGKGIEEFSRDDIDKKVLSSGIRAEVLDENLLGQSTFRITIPYKAEVSENINCLSCHAAKKGDVLGVISMVMTVDDVKLTSSKIIMNTTIIGFILILFVLFFIQRLMGPYLSIFQSIKDVMSKANDGDYSGRIQNFNSGESKDVAHWINSHMNKLQTNLVSIEDKIDIFLTAHKSTKDVDPIVDVEHTVTRLADIYKFRKTIEHDENIFDVYSRLAVILEQKFKIENFNFIEADTTNKLTEVVYINKALICDPISDGCRSDRTNTLVDSCQFSNVCDKFKDSDKTYLCIPYSISNDLDFILSIVSNDNEEHERVRALIPLIQDYVDAAKPEIVSKKLMQVLETSAQTDPLTGLFNRKFLESYIDGTLYKGKYNNIPCGVMMVDIDLFKLINDNYGHDIGDIAIKTISNTLLDVITQDDVVIRFGGEEFIVIVSNCTEERLQELAENIRIAFSQQKIQAGNEEFSKTVSIGTAMFPNKEKNFWKYVKQSDIALYSAKQTGRNKVVRYHDSMES